MHESGGANTSGCEILTTSAVAIFFFSWSSGDTYSLPSGRLPVGRATLPFVRAWPSAEWRVLSTERESSTERGQKSPKSKNSGSFPDLSRIRAHLQEARHSRGCLVPGTRNSVLSSFFGAELSILTLVPGFIVRNTL